MKKSADFVMTMPLPQKLHQRIARIERLGIIQNRMSMNSDQESVHNSVRDKSPEAL